MKATKEVHTPILPVRPDQMDTEEQHPKRGVFSDEEVEDDDISTDNDEWVEQGLASNLAPRTADVVRRKKTAKRALGVRCHFFL